MKDRCTGNEDIGAVLDRQSRSLGVDAAVHFDVDLVRARFVPFGGAFYFFHLIGAKRLPSETGMDSHDEQQVDLFEERLDRFKRRCGIQC